MAYVRTRTTKAGATSTALVEAYRDDQGRPRNRLLVNLHGEPDVPSALVKLLHMRSKLADEWKEYRTTNKMATAKQRRREDQIDRYLAVIEKDVAILEKHCTASDEELQAALDAFQKRIEDAVHLILGIEVIDGARF